MSTARWYLIAWRLIVVIVTYYNTYPQRGWIVRIIDRLTFVAVVQQPSAHQVLKNTNDDNMNITLYTHTHTHVFVVVRIENMTSYSVWISKLTDFLELWCSNKCLFFKKKKNSEVLHYYTHTYLYVTHGNIHVVYTIAWGV